MQLLGEVHTISITIFSVILVIKALIIFTNTRPPYIYHTKELGEKFMRKKDIVNIVEQVTTPRQH